MTLLVPLGLLGLLSLIVLLIIYILKPNYQQKFVSSTYIWKLSLKYRRKKIPTSKLRNLLIILCQVLILSSLAMLLAQPAKALIKRSDDAEVIAILDSSASMRTVTGDETRFERGISGIQDLSDRVLSGGGTVSVIIADKEASYLKQRVTSAGRNELSEELQKLVSDDACSYGVSDIDAAITLCDDVLKDNPDAEIYLFTDKTYLNKPQTVNVVDVTAEGEWNVAIVNAYTQIEENYYTIYVDIACYGRDYDADFTVNVNGAEDLESGESINYSFNHTVTLQSGVVKTVIFRYSDEIDDGEEDASELVEYYALKPNERFYSYQSIHISIDENDSLKEDNNFDIYSGRRETLKVVYASSNPNPFVSGTLLSLKNYYANVWDFQITELRPTDETPTSGYDFYIFEHSKMPKIMPTDGAVFLFDPDENIPADSGITIGREYDLNKNGAELAKENDHPLLEDVYVDRIWVTRYRTVTRFDPAYTVLMTCAADPVVFVRNDGINKIAVVNFSVHYSNITMRNDFSYLMLNMFECFIPSIVRGNSFEVYESVSLSSRGDVLHVTGGLENFDFETFPAVLKLDVPGTYTLSQTTYFDKEVIENIFVRIPASESDIKMQDERLKEPYSPKSDSELYRDLAVIFAAILVAVLFIEWWLQTRDNG